MIIPRSEDYITFKKINLKRTLLFSKNIKNIALNLLNINKTCAKNTDQLFKK